MLPSGSLSSISEKVWTLPILFLPRLMILLSQFHLAPDPAAWGSNISHAEPDDALHDPRRDHNSQNVFTGRGFQNVGCMALLCACILGIL
jgi:hypothetical protein